jgi:hypothetical protein
MTTRGLRISLLLLIALVGAAVAQERTMGLLCCDSAAFTGYTLFAPMRYNVTYLIDNQGRRINSWTSGYRPGLSAYLLENGDLLRTACVSNPLFTTGGTGGRVERFDWDGNLVWSYEYSSDQHCQHHDIRMLPSGNVLMVAWELKTQAEALDAGRNPDLLIGNTLWPDHIIEVDPRTDSICWEWHLWDHLIQRYDSTRQNYGIVRDHPELVNINYVTASSGRADWTHCNAVAYNPEFDQVMISSRYFSETWVIDPRGGWSLGRPLRPRRRPALPLGQFGSVQPRRNRYAPPVRPARRQLAQRQPARGRAHHLLQQWRLRRAGLVHCR